MALPPALTQNSLAYALNVVQNYASITNDHATTASATMAAGPVDTIFVFNLLDALNGLMANLNAVKNTTGLNAYATANVPGYTGNMITDITATVNAAQACIDWVVTTFPKDGSGWLLGYQLNSDGTRVPRTFSTAATAGFRTALNALVATIG
jgi:hypothetical protein